MRTHDHYYAVIGRRGPWTQGLFTLLLLSCTLLWAAVASSTPSGGGYTITRSTVDGGGGRVVGGDFTISGTIGQADAQPIAAHGGDYGVAGGFWAQAAQVLELIFKDGFESP